MANYAESLAILFGHLKLEQAALVVEKLSIEEIKILSSHVLPQIKDMSYLRHLRKVLSKRTSDINEKEKKSPSIPEKTLEYLRINDRLNNLFETVSHAILNELSTPKSIALFLKTANDDEIFVIQKELQKDTLDASEAELSAAFRQELDRRASQDVSRDWKSDYKAYWREKRADVNWKSKIWCQVTDKINATNLEIKRIAAAERNAALNPPQEEKQSFFAWIGSVIAAVWSYIISWFKSTNTEHTLIEQGPGAPFKAELSQSEQEDFEKMRREGAQYTNHLVGMSGLGEAKQRSADARKASIAGRYGLILASQVIAGSRGKNHGQINTVAESLATTDDSDTTVSALYTAITSAIEDEPSNPLKGIHIFASTGDDVLVSALESQDLTNILKNNESYSEYGLRFTAEERAQIAAYKGYSDQSKSLNDAIGNLAFSWGGYASDGPGRYKEQNPGFKEAQETFDKKVTALSKAVLNACADLKDGESLFLNTGLEGHAMKLSIQRVGEQFKFTCYDSSGALENSTMSESLMGLIRLQMMGYEAKRSNALSFSIPAAKLLAPAGETYFNNLIRQHSYAGWAETNIKENLSPSTSEERSRMSWINRILALRRQSKVYLTYIDKFTAIADPQSPPAFDPLLQYAQNTSNCFAKRLQSCQLYELGKPTYKKLRMAVLIEQKKGLIDDICGKPGGKKGEEEEPFLATEYLYMLKNIQPEFLSPEELHEASMQLSEIAQSPSKEYYEVFFKSLLKARDKLIMENRDSNKIAIDHIDMKITNHAKSYYLYLKKGNRQEEIEEFFSPEVYSTKTAFDWNSATLPLKDGTSIGKLSEYVTAQAWKASIQLINHQIKKTGVNERYIQSPSERLTHASYREAAKSVTLADLKQANIVSFTSGMSRTDDIKIELNIGGVRKEVDKETFFKLVVNHKGALTNPQVINLLDYLRNASAKIEQRFDNQVYPAQRVAFEDILAANIAGITNKLMKAIDQLMEHENNIAQMIVQCKENLDLVAKDAKAEIEKLGAGKSSGKLNNIESRQELITVELEHLQSLKRSVSSKKESLMAAHTVQNAPNHRITRALQTLQQMGSGEPEMQTVRAVTTAFFNAQSKLDAVAHYLEAMIASIETDEVEALISERTKGINEYHKKVIKNGLQANAEYLVLDELASGRMGTEKDRNRNMYARWELGASEEGLEKTKKTGYAKSSVLAKIQGLSKYLKEKTEEILEHKITLESITQHDGMQSLVGTAKAYQNIEDRAQALSKLPIPQKIKDKWVNEMFQIWLEHEDPKVMYSISKKGESEITDGVNHAFHHFIEQKANIKLAALKTAGYPIVRSKTQIDEMGWMPVSDTDMEKVREKQSQAAMTILKKLRGIQEKISPKASHKPVHLHPEDLVSQHDPLLAYTVFKKPTLSFLSQEAREQLDSSTLEFLSGNKVPKYIGSDKLKCLRYHNDVLDYLGKLKSHNGLENKKQRLIEFCISASSSIFALPVPPSSTLIDALSKTIINGYRDEEAKSDESLNKSFLKMENTERSQLLTALLQLNLSPIQIDGVDKVKVNSVFFSMIKHWERVIVPRDANLSDKIFKLSPGGAEPVDITLLKEVDNAIQKSPIGLEGIYEGQKGLQMALQIYGQADKALKIEGNEGAAAKTSSDLRKEADRLTMRNGDALLPSQFIHYYAAPDSLFSIDGVNINSAQGREFFSRALLDAYQHANKSEKSHLLEFLNGLDLNEKSNTHTLKTKHHVFRDELLMRCALIDPEPVSYSTKSINELIDELTAVDSEKAQDRLFGFAKGINLLSIEIEQALLEEQRDEAKLDKLYSRLICTNLAYQSILDQASKDEIANINENFEYQKEMSLVQSNINKLQDDLVRFSSQLGTNNRSSVFIEAFNQFREAAKFDGHNITITEASSSNIPGLISIGSFKSLDILHGVVYVGNHKLGIMPAYIQSHLSLQVLEINNHPFQQDGGAYIYSEKGKANTSVTQLENGTLIVQRALLTLDGTNAMLQYLSSDEMGSLPTSIKSRLNAKYFFIDIEGAIHAYSSDFKPVLKLALEDKRWSGELLDHNGSKISMSIDSEASELSRQLVKVFPYEEMISVDQNTIYIPSLHQYIVKDKDSDNYLIMDKPPDTSSKRIFKLGEHGSGYTEKVLAKSESEEVKSLQTQIVEQQKQLDAIKKSDIVSQQDKSHIEKKITEYKNKILAFTSPEYFIFIPTPAHIQKQEALCSGLKKKMDEVYLELHNSKGKGSAHYDEAKKAYLSAVKQLKQSCSEENHSITFRVAQDGALMAKDFQSVLHLGTISTKTPLFVELLGHSIPRMPLSASEQENMARVKKEYAKRDPLKAEDRTALILLTGIELQHHILEREAHARGKNQGWDRVAFAKLLIAFKQQVTALSEQSRDFPLNDFSELWKEIQAEFESDLELYQILDRKKTYIPFEQKPISLNSKTTHMPIESIGGRPLIQFSPHANIASLIDKAQSQLEERLHELHQFGPSTQAQEDGYYYENYGVFNNETLARLFRVLPDKPGVGGLTQENIDSILNRMLEQGWIKLATGMTQFQLTEHPAKFFSAQKISAYLSDMGLDRLNIRIVTDRMETFLYETAVNGGKYAIKPEDQAALIKNISSAQSKYNIENLQARDKIESLLAQAKPPISMAELNAAYLLNDYSRISSSFPPLERVQIEIALNNGLTRMMYYKTELDHLNDVQDTFKKGNMDKAISMMHIKRNYKLEKLLDSEVSPGEVASEVEKERKMQRAFLLFEYDFSHRCNARQVDIFRGLLLEDETNPDKIDSAQARMGFGKTSLLPLVALYKTGEKLVRFVVPKSALETNTSDMSSTLTTIIGVRAVKDDFQRYRIASDPQAKMGENSPRLQSLQDAKADLKKRLSLYERIRDNREVLVQAPNVRNALECQSKVFLDLLLTMEPDPDQEHALMECISLTNKIRSLTSITIFDELDATQDSATTDVNYTAGKKIPIDASEIIPLELITQAVCAAEDRTTDALAQLLLEKFKISDVDGGIFKYITDLRTGQPSSVTFENSTAVYLMRAVLTDPAVLNLLTKKEPSTDFGVWFENSIENGKQYDYGAVHASGGTGTKNPLLIAVPYAAANTPKPKGSRFDNPQVTAMATFLYYLDKRTKIEETPHLEFLIDSLRNGVAEALFFDANEKVSPEFKVILEGINEIAKIPDPLLRNAARKVYFDTHFNSPEERSSESSIALRKMLARTIIKEQIKFDAGKANSNRYEQGTTDDSVLGFSGTAGDTSSHFKISRLDPAADGNMTLGIMGRENCQKTISLDTARFTDSEEDYTTTLITQLAQSFSLNTRTLIDVGGLCKTSNREVAKAIAIQLGLLDSSITYNGVIFYDDVTNTKKLLKLDADNNEVVVDLTIEMVCDSDTTGCYFTYYDQAHCRGADIKQMDLAEAVLTLNFTITNSDYKQAIMRMRKIVDKTSGQSFSTAVPDVVRAQILSDLDFDEAHELSGNDVAYWLRQKELTDNLSNVSLLTMEMDSVIKNAILQQQAKLTQLISEATLIKDDVKIALFHTCIEDLNKRCPFISGKVDNLKEKYGKVFGKIQKQKFVADLKSKFETDLTSVFDIVNQAKVALDPLSAPLGETDKKPYYDMEEQILQKREPQLSDEVVIPSSSDAMSEVQSESQSESQSQSQSQSQAQTHSFSQVNKEDVGVETVLHKQDIQPEPISLDFLSSEKALSALPLASQSAHIKHMFQDEELVSCSPVYQLRQEAHQPLPPIRYFLAREKGKPLIIFINQDEADLFKKSDNSGWRLYDITLQKSKTIDPVVGEPVASLKGPLLKKLYFSTFRYPIKSASIQTLADSLEGIYPAEQLKPSLDIQYADGGEHSIDESVFSLPEWGFCGDKAQDIPLEIERTHKVFNKGVELKPTDENYNKGFEKTGVTIKVGTANVFISSKIEPRLLAAIDKADKDRDASHKPLAKQIENDLNLELSATKQKITKNKTVRSEVKAQKIVIIQEADKTISALKEKRDAAISRAKSNIETSFAEKMKLYLNARVPLVAILHENLDHLSKSTDFGNGITVNRKKFPSIRDAIQQRVVKEILERSQALSADIREIQLNLAIHHISDAAYSLYQKQTCYDQKKGSFIEAMVSALDKMPKGRKGAHPLINLDQIKLWEGRFKDVLYEHFNHFYENKTMWDGLHDCFEQALSDYCTGKDFEMCLIARFDTFAKKIAPDNSDYFYFRLMTTLSYTLNDGNALKYQQAVQADIENVVIQYLGESLSEPTLKQEELYRDVSTFLKGKMRSYDFVLPAKFNQVDASPQEIKEAIVLALANQNIKTTGQQLEQLTKECIGFMEANKAVRQLFENYTPAENRSAVVKGKDGKQHELSAAAHEAIKDTDLEVSQIDVQIAAAEELRQEKLKKNDKDRDKINLELEKNNEKLQTLKVEKSACNKLLSGLKKMLSIFTSKSVSVKESQPEAFFDAHFDCGRILCDKAPVSAKLTFMPPEFYDVTTDMTDQHERMHGVSRDESPAKQTVDAALKVVETASGLVQERQPRVKGVRQASKTPPNAQESLANFGLFNQLQDSSEEKPELLRPVNAPLK